MAAFVHFFRSIMYNSCLAAFSINVSAIPPQNLLRLIDVQCNLICKSDDTTFSTTDLNTKTELSLN